VADPSEALWRIRGNDGKWSTGLLNEVLGRSIRVLFFVTLWIAAVLSFPVLTQAAEKIRVGLSVRNVVFLPFYYAQERNVYQKYGLEVELIQMRSDLQTVGLLSGEIDFTPAIGPAILGIDNGMPLKAIAVVYRSPLFSLVSPPSVNNPKELEGKRVAVSRLGSDSHRYGVLMLEKSGVDPKKVTFIQTGSTTVSLTALQQESVTAAVLSPPFTGAMAEKGFKVFMRSRALVEAPWLGLVTSRQKLQKQSDQVGRMLRAMREVVGAIRQDKHSVIAYIEKSFNVTRPVAEESYEDIRDVIVEELMMPEGQVKAHLDSSHARGELRRALAPSDVFDFSLLKAAR
jgi:ABC-type nitrate/sulfonate/bicarbonate transport system substrate-binding protein